MKNSIAYVIERLLQENKVKIDSEELIFQVESHPSYPSLHAITGVLTHFKIQNLAIELPLDKTTLSQLPSNFIAQVKTSEGTRFALVINKNSDYTLIFSQKISKTISFDDFLLQFTGVVVIVEAVENVLLKNKKNYTKPFFYLSMLSLAILVLITKNNFYESFHFLLSLVGVITSLLIVQYEINGDAKFISGVCSEDSKKVSCGSVLNSKGSYIYKDIKISEISLIYFSTICIIWFLFSLTGISPILLIYLSIASIPAIIYSLYYQAFILHKWCVLCLSIVTVLLAQLILLPNFEISEYTVSIVSILIFAFSLTSMISIWLLVFSSMKKNQKFNKLKIESVKFKKNFKLFNAILQNSKSLDMSSINSSKIVFGNRNAPLNITLITNPFCVHCKSAHYLVENILETYDKNVQITVLFNISTKNEQSDLVKVTSRLIEIYHVEGEKLFKEAIHSIYEGVQVKEWFSKWNEPLNFKNVIEILEKEREWCENNGINFTPKILLNGRSFPEMYERKDLLYFVEDLIDLLVANFEFSYS
ncbi:vitamin K epoxide reductase family protein [Aquimarina sp. ERC-38]|uniref:vitamin K epoxide reductase family protein n=1 Tax=Aquimarina sp. ERC-38 TaxID=2949996 RepID=UPI0022453543|nr:vitamin K epoxide reductase family protein [Aquimarina sp. ERC-38]UZO80820.1 vitamin K epoxide reductase family protein [Aquimarina sp. ERC-38]